MSDYRRLISYIYNYEKGIKKNNVGFAKIELRNGQCKISINIKAASLNGQKLKTYVFYRENKKMIQILLAEAVVKNGIFEWKGITNAKNIMNTGCDFNQLGGVLLYYTLDRYYATEWDDQPIVLNQLYEWNSAKDWKRDVTEAVANNSNVTNIESYKESHIEAPKSVVKEISSEVKSEAKFIEIPKEEVTYIKKKQEAEEALRNTQEEIVQSILKSIDCNLELFYDANDNTKTGQKTKSEVTPKSKLEAAELNEETNNSNNKVNVTHEQERVISAETAKLVGYRFINWYRSQETGFPKADGMVNVANIVAEQEQQDVVVEEEISEEVDEVQAQDNGEQESQVESKSQDELESLEEQESPQELESQDRQENEDEVATTLDCEDCINTLFEEEKSFYDANTEKEWNERLEEVAKKKTSTAERILQKYPAIYPFEDDEIIACSRIEPGDIGLFPIENWVLGNNSFLLHGYYNFRHLIFAKRKIVDGEEYILGVPGIYQNREKFMAKMFGFTQFKCSKVVEQKTGEFGYWYIKVNM
ncbi:DUF6128 domain-containing protein [Anaerosporobacter sp.]|uniref:DUF6128 domain-containing protein n=1 Tax=Anaerosporobacter sp. TaxID=1872529 RepID=UPI00286F955F|nr:DUF6128 domain-containing protein [Anaerosporobacter sp.]